MKNQSPSPPRHAEKLLLRFLKEELAEEVLGDLDEKFFSMAEKHSLQKARTNYWYQVFKYIRPFALKKSKLKYNNHQLMMYKHYFKISWRSLLRNKVYSGIKIGGFAVGIAACILIALFVRYELSYDKHYTEGDRIFRIANSYSYNDVSDRWTNLQGPFKEVLETHVPEIELVARTVLWSWGNAGNNHVRPIEERNNIYETDFIYADPELLPILEVPMVFGQAESALSAPNSIVLTREKAEKYFPGQNPLGRQLILNDDTKTTFTIGGVIEDWPENSHLKPGFIMTLAERTSGPGTTDWCCSNYNFYTRLKAGSDKSAVEKKMVDIRDTYVLDELGQLSESELAELKNNRAFYFQPVDQLYLNPQNVYDHQTHGSEDMIWTFSAIAVIILFLACLNFVNLSTAKSLQRAKEVGLRKVVGSQRGGLIHQHLAESVFYSTIAVMLGLGLAVLALPYFNQLANQPLTLPWQSWWFIPGLAATALLIGLFSGIYPALFLSKFSPIAVLKGNMNTSNKTSAFRGGMVVFQFTATVVLIIAALVTHSQFDYFMKQELGYEKEQVVNVLGLNSLQDSEQELLKEEILRLPAVENATLSDFLPVAGAAISNFNYWVAERRHTEDGFEAARWRVDEDYIATMGMELLAGRNFTKATSDEKGIIINERMAQLFGLEDPVGTELIDMFDGRYHIIGVVKDFYFESLAGNVRPLVMVREFAAGTLSIKLNSSEMASAMKGITQVWDEVKPTQPIRYSFLDQRFESMYSALQRANTIFIIFSGLSVLVACLGLFALSAFSIEQRGKEIGVRKVLGASTFGIFKTLSMRFVRLVLIAIVIGIPIGWYLMDDLLNEFANRIELSWQLFGMSAAIALFIAFFTISFESVKAALVNPAQRLRSE